MPVLWPLNDVPGVLGSAGHTSELCPQKGSASVLLLLLGRQKRNLVRGNIGVWESGHEIIRATRPAV